MALSPQQLHATGHSVEFHTEGGDEEKPKAMPKEDAHANKAYFGPAGTLKRAAGRGLQGNDLNARPGSQGSHRLQKARKRK